MNTIRFDLFPGGRSKALTLSYDDGTVHDRRFVEILNRHGLKGTFHLNSGALGCPGYLEPKEVRDLFFGHEVSAHTCSHPHLTALSPEQMAWQILEDRRALEALVDYTVRGMSYPFGSYNRDVLERLPALGIEYARTTKSNEGYDLPDDFLEWHPTCHHNTDLSRKTADFVVLKPKGRLLVFYIWGHSHDLERENKWEMFEKFGAQVAHAAESIWFATNSDILDYVRSRQSVRVSVDGHVIQNLSHRSIWISINDQSHEVVSGETMRVPA